MQKLGDPDWAFLEELSSGVPLGVGVEMPRTPAVYDPKVKWALDDLGVETEREVENYRSTEGYEERIKELFEEEAGLGWMVEMTDEQARELYGDKLHVAALGVVVEQEKFRVVHDGTHGVGVNHRIRVRDQVRSPTAGEAKTLLRKNSPRLGAGGTLHFWGTLPRRTDESR